MLGGSLHDTDVRRAGIVTSFDLYTTAQDRVWFELNQYSAAQIPQLLAALVEYEGAAEQDSKAGLIFSPTSNLTAVGLFYAAPAVRPSIFRSFYSIPPYQALVPPKNVTLADLSPAFSSPVEAPTKWVLVTMIDIQADRIVQVRYRCRVDKSQLGALPANLQCLRTDIK